MISDSNQPNVSKATDEGLGSATEPTLSWSELDLRQFLADAWDQKIADQIQVIGRLRFVDGESFGFLEDLHHPETGVRLSSPVSNARGTQGVFVPPAELRNFLRHRGNTPYAIAKVDLSTLQKRIARDDPLACTVRPKTLEVMSQIPESWGVHHTIESETVPLILEKARLAIEDRLGRATAEAEEGLRSMTAAQEDAAAKHRLLGDELRKIKRKIDEGASRINVIEADAVDRREALESKFRELETFLMERGERMVALDLVDKAVLEKLFPSVSTSDVRVGHAFGEALSGDSKQLAGYVQAYLWRKGMRYSRAQLLDFITLLRTHDLIVLAGDSGSGKTSLIKSVAAAIGGQCTIVPVKPNWTGSEDLLGYYNPIEGRYQPSQFLLALLKAARDPEVPHFICLDEMNLARVEFYFADFLSLLETREEAPWIPLYSTAEERQAVVDNRIFLALEQEARKRAGLSDEVTFEEILMNDQANLELRKLAGFQESDTLLAHHAKIRRSISGLIEIPSGFAFPKNVWIIGAINVDETTHYLSPKILDRAHVMRFRNPVLVNWEQVEAEVQEFDLDIDLPMNVLAGEIGVRAEYPRFDQADQQVTMLVALARNYLDPLGIEFGIRAIRQSLNYIKQGSELGIDPITALNNVALHKILPKIVLDMEKASANGQKRRDVLIGLRDELQVQLLGHDESMMADSAVEALDDLIARAEGNNGIANFWAR